MKGAALALLCVISFAQGRELLRDRSLCACNPGDAQAICATPGFDGTVVAHQRCDKFYRCAHGRPVAQCCPRGLLYNIDLNRCDWPSNVECGNRVVVADADNECLVDSGGGDHGGGGEEPGVCHSNPSEAPAICGAAGSEGVLVAHEYCNYYYICSHGRPVGTRCASGLLYDPCLRRCTWAHAVDCAGRPIKDVEDGDTGGNEPQGPCHNNPAEAPAICAVAGSDGTLVAHQNCHQFYECMHGRPITQSCSTGLLFDPCTRRCDWPNNVDCGDRIDPNCDCDETEECDGSNPDTGGGDGGDSGSGGGDGDSGGGGDGDGDDGGSTCNCNPGDAPAICAQTGSDGVLIAHENCDQFYKCSFGRPVPQCCPAGLLYDPHKGICDWPQNVDCGDRVISNNTQCGGGDGGDGGGDSGDGGGEGDSGSGDGGGGGGSCGCNPGDAPATCAQPGSNGAVIAHENCNQFYKCAHGKPVAYCCPGNLLFNPCLRVCDWPQNVDCGDRVISNNTQCSDGGTGGGGDTGDGGGSWCDDKPGDAPATCAQSGSNGALVPHENCNQFYQCAHGRPVAFCCPSGLMYNPCVRVCDWPDNVDCGGKGIANITQCPDVGTGGDGGGGGGGGGSTCNCNPNDAPALCAQTGSDGVLIVHENCNQFYRCASGLPVAQCCPAGLLYDRFRQICDWHQNVECGDRVISDSPQCGGSGGGGGDSGSGGGGDSGSGGGGGSDGGGGSTCNCNPGDAPTICTQTGSEGVLVAHENCNQFYKCSFGIPVPQCCPAGLSYDPYKEICDWPQNVDCGNRVTSNTQCGGGSGGGDSGGGGGGGGDGGSGGGGGSTCNCNPGDAPAVCAQTASDGYLIAHENCNQFYKCAYGLPVPQCCPAGLSYDPYKEICDWPQNVDCGNRVTSNTQCGGGSGGGDSGGGGGGGGDGGSGGGGGSTCNCNPGDAPAVCAQTASDGYLIAHENCNQFYKCAYGLPVAQCCPAGLSYDPYKEICDWPQNVDCGNRVTSNTQCGGGSGGGDSGGGGGGGGDGGSGGGGGSTCNCNPGDAPAVCAQTASDGYLIAHENCNQFYKCAYGLPVAQCCPAGLLYDPYQEICDWPQNVDCGNRVNSGNTQCPGGGTGGGGGGGDSGGSGDGGSGGGGGSTCNCNPGDAPVICSQAGSNGVLIAHENCNRFYKCAYGNPVSQCCPAGLLYDPYKEICDWPQNVKCENRIIPNAVDECGGTGGGGGGGSGGSGDGSACNCNPSDAPAICARSGSDGVLIAHENCNRFYKCADGKHIPQCCPSGLFYNPYLEVCDWPHTVTCGERLVLDAKEDECGKDSENDSGNSSGSEDCDSGNIEGGNNDCNCNPAEAAAICSASGSDGTLIAHTNCNQFYKCTYGAPVALTCPGILLYNTHTQQCDWPNTVSCGDRIIPKSDSDNDSNNEGNQAGSENSDGDNINNSPINCDPSEAPAICRSSGSQGVLVAHENCNQFYQCTNNIPVAHICSPPLLYNPYTQQCDWASNVDCTNRVISENNVPSGVNGGGSSGSESNNIACYDDPKVAPEVCATVNSNGVLIAHEHCDKFYKCSGGIPITLTCPPKLLFNPTIGLCDWDSNVLCGGRVTPASNSDSGCHCDFRQAPLLCSQPGSDGIFIAHENCNQYYVCAQGRTIAHTCPHHLRYNPKKEVCDWPAFVDCEDRAV